MNYKVIKAIDSEAEYEIKGKNTQVQKKYQDATLQVNVFHLSEDRMMNILPLEDEQGFKSYYLIAGTAMVLENSQELHPGDLVIYKQNHDMLTLKTLTSCTFLVHTSKHDVYANLTARVDTMDQLLKDIQCKDHYTGEHSIRVYELVKALAMRLGYKNKALDHLIIAAHYHDLGKIHIDDDILNKPGKLTDEEYDYIKTHVTASKEMIVSHFSEIVYYIIEQHHERYDGSGYPFGLIGEEILPESRILAICDSFDAMITDRVYKKGKTIQTALEELSQLSGTLYDPVYVSEFIRMIQDRLEKE